MKHLQNILYISKAKLIALIEYFYYYFYVLFVILCFLPSHFRLIDWYGFVHNLINIFFIRLMTDAYCSAQLN